MRPTPLAAIAAAGLLTLVGACSSESDDPAAEGPTPTLTSAATPTASEPTAPGPDGEGVPAEPDPDETASGASDDSGAVPWVTYAGPGEPGTWEISAMVPGIVEEGGTCRFTLTAPGRALVEVTTSGSADASSTVCETAVVPSGDLAAGQWSVVLEYTGSGGSRTSEPTTLDVS